MGPSIKYVTRRGGGGGGGGLSQRDDAMCDEGGSILVKQA